MTKKNKKDVVSEFRCSEILDAARRVFAQKGFAGATVDEIAEAAGLAKGTVYLYFPSKRALYVEAVKGDLSGLIEQMKRNLDASPEPAAKLRAFIETRLRYAEEHREFINIYHAEFGSIGPAEVKKELRRFHSVQAQLLEGVLRDALAQGQTRPVPVESAAFMLCEMTRGIVVQRVRGWAKASVEEEIDFLFDLIWKGLAAPAALVAAGEEC